jgi:hypothetical protein
MEELHGLWKNRSYRAAVFLSAVFGYGFFVTHATVGIDDTASAYYFEDGLAVVVGRWVFFLGNQVVQVARFAPFLTDLAGVLFLVAGAAVWCLLWKRIFADKVPLYGYLFFSCLLLTNSLHSEVFPYYLHNGVGLGYLLSGLSLCFFWEWAGRWTARAKAARAETKSEAGMEPERRPETKQAAEPERRPEAKPEAGKLWKPWLASVVCLWAAIGCYESFMVVYLAGVCLALCSARLLAAKVKALPSLAAAAAAAVAALVLRSLMVALVVRLFGLESLRGEAVQRSVGEMLDWLLEPGALSQLWMFVKRVFVMYGVFAYAYYPVAVYVAAVSGAFFFSIWSSLRRKDPWIFLFYLGSVAASYLLVLVEGKATYYRSAQFLPLVSAWGFLLLAYALRGLGKFPAWAGRRVREALRVGAAVMGAVVVWNQCADMNRWFYVDYLKYEAAKDTVRQVAYELEKNFDISKPVIFTGSYQIPKSLVEAAYVGYHTEVFDRMNRLTTKLDPHLLEKFYREYGVWVAQLPSLSVVDWGISAFGTDRELIRFFAMHGYELRAMEDVSAYAEAETSSRGLPSFPEQGSIVDMGAYTIVHF